MFPASYFLYAGEWLMTDQLSDTIQSLEHHPRPMPAPTEDELLQFAEKVERFFADPGSQEPPPRAPLERPVAVPLRSET